MAKCKSCGSEFADAVKSCPECGDLPVVESISDVSGLGLKEKRAVLLEEMKEHPHCTEGEVGGAETITDLPPLNLKEKHRQLKEEIREAKEKRKHEHD
ncbi:MAG: hypothetical protein KKF41_06005 [Actinobacteria bacterium]|nr:hypothetical protein [Actinomycetota bacterium]MBU1944815.1 hypothetical protein [Actinomycetota bacterium]MBU2687118.1 hypothetical protein [Actinomycetota bacterium]